MTSLHEEPDQLKLADVETWKRILAELSLESPSEEIRNCIKAYDPEKPTKQNTKTLKRITALYRASTKKAVTPFAACMMTIRV